MHSTACGVSAAMTTANANNSSLQSSTDVVKMVHNGEDAMNKIPLKSSTLDDEEKNGGEFIHDTATDEEARREEMRANILKWMKKLTIVLICFIGVALITYVIISLCFSDWSKSSSNSNTTSTTTAAPQQQQQQPTTAQTILETTSFPLSPQPPIIPPTETASTTTTTITFAPTSIPLNNSLSTADDSSATTTPIPLREDNSTSQQTENSNNDDDTPPPTLPVKQQGTTTPIIPIFALKDKPNTVEKFESQLGVYPQAAICSDKEICSQIGSHILEQGGSAVDSAIAALLCNGIVTMQSMGIGGGMLMNVYIKESKSAYSIDAREVAPYAAHENMFDDDLMRSMHGGLSIAVPGELMGYQRAHEQFGKLPWKTLVEPALKLCNEGFYMSHHQHMALRLKLPHLKNNTILTNIFIDSKTGNIHPIGTKLQPPKELCDTYALLAENGPLDFYNGTLSKLIVEDLTDLGSTITPYDLESYTADLVMSITMQLGNDTLYALPPISSGTVVASILSILEGYNFTKSDWKDVKSQVRTIHRIVEALKYGFAKRWELGDLRFNDVRELVSKLTNPENNMEIRAQINETFVHPTAQEYGAQFSGTDDVGTSHLSVVAPNGDAVSVTSSVNDYFGAGQAGKRTGIIFNSGMNDFSIAGQPNMFNLPPAPSNYIDSRKRAMSSMSPMILADQEGDVHLVLGAAGGAKIISAIVEIIVRVLWFDENIKEAIDAPRFHHQLMPDTLLYEANRFDEEVLRLLEAHGHHTKPYKDIGSVACGILRKPTGLYVNADYRKRGGIAGF